MISILLTKIKFYMLTKPTSLWDQPQYGKPFSI